MVEDIWDTLASEGAEIDLSEEQLAELESRRADMLRDPSVGISWEAARERLFGKP